MSQTQILDLITLVPAIPLDRVRTYIELPAFSVSGIVWAGASVIVQQYNFSADSNFYLDELPDKPTGVNYGLCIRYRVGAAVYRYKLWDDALFILPAVNLYDGEVIKKNFVLEVWSFQDETTAVQDDAIQMITSRRIVPSSLRSMDDVSLATGAEVDFATLQGSNAALSRPPEFLYLAYQADDIAAAGPVTNWPESIGSSSLVASGLNAPLCVAAGINGHNYVEFDGVDDLMSAVSIGFASDKYDAYFVINQLAWNANRQMLIITDLAADSAIVKQRTSTPNLAISDGGSYSAVTPIALNTWCILRVRMTGANLIALQVNDEDEVTLAETNLGVEQFNLGSLVANVNFRIAEALFYFTTNDYATDSNIKNYLRQKYALADAPIEDIPTTYNAASAWLTN